MTTYSAQCFPFYSKVFVQQAAPEGLWVLHICRASQPTQKDISPQK